jgi:hypothetical protein
VASESDRDSDNDSSSNRRARTRPSSTRYGQRSVYGQAERGRESGGRMRFAACWCSVCGRCSPGGAFAWPYRLSSPSLICQRALPSTTYWRRVFARMEGCGCCGSLLLFAWCCLRLSLLYEDQSIMSTTAGCFVLFFPPSKHNSPCVRQALLKPQEANTPV